jgi:hypothetical protein
VVNFKEKCEQFLSCRLRDHQSRDVDEDELVKILIASETYNMKNLLRKAIRFGANLKLNTLESVDDFKSVSPITRYAICHARLQRMESVFSHCKIECCKSTHTHACKLSAIGFH